MSLQYWYYLSRIVAFRSIEFHMLQCGKLVHNQCSMALKLQITVLKLGPLLNSNLKMENG